LQPTLLHKSAVLKIPISAANNQVLRDFSFGSHCSICMEFICRYPSREHPPKFCAARYRKRL